MAKREKFVVRLTPEHRRQLDRLVSSGKHPARVLTRARVLLKADAADGGPGWDDAAIAEALGCGDRTVGRVRQRYVEGGLDAALYARKPTGRQYRKLDGTQEAKLVALACSPAPGGRGRWTMKLLADRLVEQEVVESIDPATVWRTLKKTVSSRGSSSAGCSRRRRVRRSFRTWRTCSTCTPGRSTRCGRWYASTRAGSSWSATPARRSRSGRGSRSGWTTSTCGTGRRPLRLRDGVARRRMVRRSCTGGGGRGGCVRRRPLRCSPPPDDTAQQPDPRR